MTITYQATIKFDTKKNHPDSDCIKNMKYSDTYRIDTDRFMGYDSIEEFISHDMQLVAGGGYATDTIENIELTITEEF